jgi:predicted metal-dependent hydrolase
MEADPDVEIRRSARRRRTVSAYREGDRIIVLAPARLSVAEERRLVADLVSRITRREASRGAQHPTNEELTGRASALSDRYLDGQAQPNSVRWVSTMRYRWGSCTSLDRSIRLSDRLRALPAWVIDYVLLHELTHLLQPGHGPAFWALVNRYPRTERARGFLEGVTWAAQLAGSSSGESPGPDPADGVDSLGAPGGVPVEGFDVDGFDEDVGPVSAEGWPGRGSGCSRPVADASESSSRNADSKAVMSRSAVRP